ncbi:MAG: FKBP-type peptidyl-prolyl cis-trans isomerase [Verrucomicrobia bacterium]|nr:FKBP-type peptidyl-prolyl cis-trans isomerase [Verrucomicrobiota bacterium]MBV9659146.1 FKBP-type peptidyl-prolyl cis-trans isomerase [Verrucomicrobiota bacterium]
MLRSLPPVALLAAASATLLIPSPAPLHAQAGAGATSSSLRTPKEKLSYAIGLQIAGGLKQNNIDVDPAALTAAIRDVLTGAQPQLTEAQARETLTAFSNDMQAKQQAAAKAAGDKAHAEGDAYLASNKVKDGVKTLPDGLQYKVLKEGAGPMPGPSDTVTVHYRGTLINGTEFDSSYKRNQPASFPVGGVIKGWTEALQMMKVGSKWQLAIPSTLAYGERPPPGSNIPPGAVLLFDVELLSIQGK